MADKQVKDGTLNTHKQGCYVSNTRESFGDFDFVCDFKFAPGCNSGVFIRISKPGDSGIGRGIEVQVLDSAARKKADKHDCGSLRSPGAECQCSQAARPVESHGSDLRRAFHQGHSQRSKDHRRRHQQMGPGRCNPDGTKNKFNWAFKDQPRSGHLGLQDHGGNCWYKNIKVKRLETDKPASSN